MTTAVNDPVGLSIRQFVDAWRVMCSGALHYNEGAEDGVHYIFSGVPIVFFNVGVVTGRDVSAAALQASGQRACAWAATKGGVPWLFVITHEALAPGTDATAALDACGLAPLMPLTGMIAEHVAPPAIIPGLQCTRPQDDAGCSALLDVNSRAYGMDLAAGKDLIGTTSFWSTHYPALGFVDGEPASCAAVMMVDGYRYVALVATDPPRQRRGYGDAVMRHALELSARAHANAPTTLHATAAGRPIYERMGYRVIAEHTVFIEKKFLGGH